MGLCAGGNAWADAPVSGSDYLIKNVQTGYYLVGGMDWGTHACLHKMPQWFTFTGSDGVYTLDSHQFNGDADVHFLGTGLYVDAGTTNWTVTETATTGIFTISNSGNYLAGNGVDAAITTTTDGTAATAQWQLISYSDFVSSLSGVIGVGGVDATPYIKDPELKRNGNFTTYSGRPWTITDYDGTGTPSNFAQGQNGNNASCAESFQSSNGFKVAQTLTGLKPGQYKLTAQAFYRQDGTDTDNYPYLFVGDEKSNFPVLSGTENNMVEAYASFLADTYPVAPITFVVTSESENVTIGYANANVMMWNIFGQTQLTYYGTALINDAVAFVNGATMTADQWYYFDATVAGTYEFTAGSDLSAISYTTDGTQATTSATGSTLTASPALSATRYYFKSSSSQTLTVGVPTGAQIVNADIDFSNAIVESVVTGEKNSMTIGASSYSTTEIAGDEGSKYLFLGYGENTVTIPVAERAGNKDIVTFNFDLALADGADNHGAFYIKDADGGNIGYMKCALWSKNVANETNLGIAMNTTTFNKNGVNPKDALWNKRTSFSITLNYQTRKITTVSQIQGGPVLDPIVVEMTNTNPVAQFVVSATPSDGAGGANRRAKFGNLVITTTKGDYGVSDVSFTVKFVDGDGNKVKEDDTDRMFVEGTDISALATSADKTTFYNDGDITNNNTTEFEGATNKYVYKRVSAVNSSDEPITELEASAIITIVYDKYNKYDYTVKQKLGDAEATNRTTGTLWGDETYNYYFPKGIKSGDDYYFTETTTFNGTLTAASPTATINYALDPTVVFYSEGEDLVSKTGTFTYYASISANGSCGVLNAADGNKVTSLSAGIYTITARTAGRGDGSRNIYFYKGSVGDGNIVLTANPGNYTATVNTSAAFAITEATNILVKGAEGGGQNGRGLDYVIITKYPSNVNATIGSTGWTTFASVYPIDLSDMTASTGEVAAYYASAIGGDKVTMTFTEQAAVAAGEGIMLKGTAGATVTVPVVATGTAISGNKLVGCTATTALTANEGYYVLVNNGGTAEFQSLVENGATIPAGKAYLNASGAGARLGIVFDDEATGISLTPSTSSKSEGSIYTLSGQRVEKARKGLYIVNGKKIVK